MIIINIKYLYFYLLLLCCYGLVRGQQIPLNPVEVQPALQLVELFGLQSIYPNESYICQRPPVDVHFVCSFPPTNDTGSVAYINKFNFTNRSGLSRPIIPSGLIGSYLFRSLFEINVENIQSPPNFLISLFNISTINCRDCEITQFPSINQIVQVSKLILVDNPIEGVMDLSGFPSIVQIDIYVTKPNLLRDSTVVFNQSGYFSLTSINIQTNEILFSGIEFPSIYGITIYLGPNFKMESFSNIYQDTNTTSFLNLYDLFSTKQYLFPNINKIKGVTRLMFSGINFVGVSTALDLSNLNQLYELVIINSPNLSDEIYPLAINSNLYQLIIKGCGLKNMPDYNNILELDALYLDNNKITSLEVFPYQQSKIGLISVTNNLIGGTLDQSYCYISITLTNNSMVGNIPSCYMCSIWSPNVGVLFDGNSFTNYPSNQPYPPCTTRKVVVPAKYVEGDSHITLEITDGGSDSFAYSYDISRSIMSIVKPNLYYDISGINTTTAARLVQLKYFPLTMIGIPLPGQNTTVNVTLTISPPFISLVGKSIRSSTAYAFLIVGVGFGNLANLTVQIGDYQCLITSIANNVVQCYIPDSALTMVEGTYIIRMTVRQYVLTYSYKFTRIFPAIVACTSPLRTGGVVTVYGLFGEGVTPANASISIGSNINLPISFINSSTLVTTIGPGKGVLSIQVTIFNLTARSPNSFVYLEDSIPCPASSNGSICSGHGQCQGASGVCTCDIGWGGLTCNLARINGTIGVGNNGTVVESGDGIQFGFRVAGIREISLVGDIVQEVPMRTWSVTSSAGVWLYRTSDHVTPTNNATVVYYVQEYDRTTNITFAGIQMTMTPGTLKMTINVTGWPYSSISNTLQLLIESFSHSNSSSCSSSIGHSDSQSSSSLSYITIERDGKVLYGRFIDRMMSDGHSTYSRTTVINQTSQSIYLGLSMPYCHECLLDPDYSVLVGAKSECTQPLDRTWVITTVAVVVSIVGASLLIIGYIIIRKKFIIQFGGSQGFICMYKESLEETNSTELDERL